LANKKPAEAGYRREAELGEALMHQNAKEISEEAGDVALVLMHLVRGAQLNKGIIQLAATALDKCEHRRYAAQGGKGEPKPKDQS